MKLKNHQDVSNVLNCFTSKNVMINTYYTINDYISVDCAPLTALTPK